MNITVGDALRILAEYDVSTPLVAPDGNPIIHLVFQDGKIYVVDAAQYEADEECCGNCATCTCK